MKYRQDSVLLNHERIHLKQQQELLIFPFYILYILEWLLKLCWYRNAKQAYLNISFEREAYNNEYNLGYLNGRKSFCFIGYLWGN
ncbi:hypothetical protein U1E44_06790 [Arenibacter sp. GZD96]|uniref:hypothetical protein n=1 Tax=Aurantibrevibacter litoralis TaxID=3106030 RepID=UPI002AFFA739|nr:hypothetical protein [Arenibacter sp. GZD-96]MEA1785791.1 hypothetical protein [Arenibacter sp. GZD-96]